MNETERKETWWAFLRIIRFMTPKEIRKIFKDERFVKFLSKHLRIPVVIPVRVKKNKATTI